MQTEISEFVLSDAIDLAGLDHDQLRTDYSGRGMYGSTCVGIVGTLNHAILFVTALALIENDPFEEETMTSLDAMEAIGEFVRGYTMSQDSMGLDSIFYWTGIQVDA